VHHRSTEPAIRRQQFNVAMPRKDEEGRCGRLPVREPHGFNVDVEAELLKAIEGRSQNALADRKTVLSEEEVVEKLAHVAKVVNIQDEGMHRACRPRSRKAVKKPGRCRGDLVAESLMLVSVLDRTKVDHTDADSISLWRRWLRQQ
jgi:hypothetical protein